MERVVIDAWRRAPGVDEFSEQGVVRVETHQITDQAATRMRDQAQARARGQGLGQAQGVVDRTLREGPVLETEDAFSKTGLQHAPGAAGGEVTEAAQGVRSGTVNEHQERTGLRRAAQARVVGGAALAVLQHGPVPAVEPGSAAETALYGLHQRLRALARGPGGGPVLGLVTQHFARLVLGGGGEFIVDQIELDDATPDPAQRATGGVTAVAKAGEVDQAIAIDQFRARACKLLGERICAHEDGRAVSRFQRQQTGAGAEHFLCRGIGAAAGRRQFQRASHFQVGQQRCAVTAIGAAGQGSQRCGQGGRRRGCGLQRQLQAGCANLVRARRRSLGLRTLRILACGASGLGHLALLVDRPR